MKRTRVRLHSKRGSEPWSPLVTYYAVPHKRHWWVLREVRSEYVADHFDETTELYQKESEYWFDEHNTRRHLTLIRINEQFYDNLAEIRAALGLLLLSNSQ